jgi:hypothetical protein
MKQKQSMANGINAELIVFHMKRQLTLPRSYAAVCSGVMTAAVASAPVADFVCADTGNCTATGTGGAYPAPPIAPPLTDAARSIASISSNETAPFGRCSVTSAAMTIAVVVRPRPIWQLKSRKRPSAADSTC